MSNQYPGQPGGGGHGGQPQGWGSPGAGNGNGPGAPQGHQPQAAEAPWQANTPQHDVGGSPGQGRPGETVPGSFAIPPGGQGHWGQAGSPGGYGGGPGGAPPGGYGGGPGGAPPGGHGGGPGGAPPGGAGGWGPPGPGYPGGQGTPGQAPVNPSLPRRGGGNKKPWLLIGCLGALLVLVAITLGGYYAYTRVVASTSGVVSQVLDATGGPSCQRAQGCCRAVMQQQQAEQVALCDNLLRLPDALCSDKLVDYQKAAAAAGVQCP